MRDLKILPFPFLAMFFLGPLFFQSGKVRIEHELPERIVKGASKEVTVRIRKGERTGFAKLELEIPDGLKVKAIEKSGASFSFESGKAKFLWMAMPEGNEFFVKYLLVADTAASGQLNITGGFQYIEENDRKGIKLEKKRIRVVDEEEMAGAGDEGKGEEARASSDAPELVREIEKIGEKRFLVHLKVDKGELDAFGRISERIPDGFEAFPDKESGSSFTFHKGTAKFVWMSLPERSSFHVRYKLVAKAVEPGEHEIEGVFSYMRDGDSKELPIPSSSIEIRGGEPTAEKGDNPSSDEEVEDSSEEGTDREETSTEEGSDVPAPQKGVDYKVQICAGHDPVDEDHFRKVYDLQADYDIEHHEGWIKYTTGKFDQYKKARDQRAFFRENFELPGPFVTAYSEGERITVQEALMISEQEWVP